MSDPSSLSRPARTAGLALLGVAALALIVGGVTALTSGNGTDDADNAADSTKDRPSATAPVTPTEGGPGGTSARPSPTTTQPSIPASPDKSTTKPGPARPGSGSGSGGGGGGANEQAGDSGQLAHSNLPLRVYNNSTIKGLAHEAAKDFRAAGWTVSSVGNYSGGRIPESTAYFRSGSDEEAAAKQLAYNFGMAAKPRFTGIQDAQQGLIVIVTNNYEGSK